MGLDHMENLHPESIDWIISIDVDNAEEKKRPLSQPSTTTLYVEILKCELESSSKLTELIKYNSSFCEILTFVEKCKVNGQCQM